MTATAESWGELPGPVAPSAIRAALPPQEAGEFDREYRRAMAEATESLDLTGVLTMLRRWQRVVWSAQDPQSHRRMLDHADRLSRGQDVPTEPWETTKARLCL
ncbi:DUF6247 family protein [Jiangella mangrovi]|uniref:Uncharacterized protein n=1 Tax=Jiangella mangrovi TaxID=1524084 RepID=A0A7W9GQ45_9ACTN|nr:DUF6247 family protein [Jiangella mangrovi]MBB5787965.1 hypothetical protein [Jiangella mangrovi]